jgi:conjugative transfer pilus assembly protein TraH
MTLRLLASAAVVALLVGTAAPARADLAQEMDQALDSMTAVTPPGVYDTLRRGVLAGGAIRTRGRIHDARLFHFEPPYIRAGCSGIDMFGGSFSFINAADLTALMRAIARNAAGYAFQLALKNMCEQCLTVINELFDHIQRLNRLAYDSCQLSQGVLNDVASAAGMKTVTDASIMREIRGIGDTFESLFDAAEEIPARLHTESPDDYARMVAGNVVWRAMKQAQGSGWFAFGDDPLLEVAMTITGTVVVGEPRPDAVTGRMSPRTERYEGDSALLGTLIDGGEAGILHCTDGFAADQCLELARSVVVIEGFEERLRRAFLGDGANPGLLARAVANAGAIPAAEQLILRALPDGSGALVLQVAKVNATGAEALVEAALPVMAIELARATIMSLYDMVSQALNTSDDEWATEAGEILDRSRRSVEAELQELWTRAGPRTELFAAYRRVMDAIPTPDMHRLMVDAEPGI